MTRRTPTSWLAFAAALLLAATAKAQNPVYVKVGATGANNGTSWTNAYTSLGAALAAAPGGEIWVAAGKYVPQGTRAATFTLASGTRIYGGFAGTETDLAQRNPTANVTELSGDRLGDDILYFGNLLDNCYHVVTATGTSATTLLDGVKVIGGYSFSGAPTQEGGGVRIVNGSLTVRNCKFDVNVSKYGGGIAILGSGTLVVEKSSFFVNEVRYGRGGGLHVGAGAEAVVTDSRFEKNHATGGSEVGRGGGINADPGAVLTVERCLFFDNDAVFGCCGGIIESTGGAIHTSAAQATIRASRFLKNEAHNGGAIAVAGPATLTDNEYSGNFAVAELGWGGYGGGLWVDVTGVATVRNDTYSRNLGTTKSGGIFVVPGGQALISNTILYNNFDIRGFFSQSQLEGATASNSCIQNMLSPAPGYPAISPALFPNSTSANPLFKADRGADNIAGTLDDDLRLDAASPCIDAGAAGMLTGLDAGGRLRLIDGNFDTLQKVDIGANEFNHVDLAITTNAVAGGTQWNMSFASASVMPTFIFIGLQRAEVNIAPYGAIWFDTMSPFVFEFVGYDPNAVVSTIAPPGTPPYPVTFQGLVIGGAQVGNFSMPRQAVLH